MLFNFIIILRNILFINYIAVHNSTRLVRLFILYILSRLDVKNNFAYNEMIHRSPL